MLRIIFRLNVSAATNWFIVRPRAMFLANLRGACDESGYESPYLGVNTRPSASGIWEKLPSARIVSSGGSVLR